MVERRHDKSRVSQVLVSIVVHYEIAAAPMREDDKRQTVTAQFAVLCRTQSEGTERYR